MMAWFDAGATAAALPFDRLVPALRAAFQSASTVPVRHRHDLPKAAALLLMPAWQAEFLGVKIVTVHPGNATAGLETVHSTYLLSDAGTGQPIALIDGDTLTARRTAAASALAASYLARPASCRLLLVGAGRVAELLPEAHRSVRPIQEVLVWNRGAMRRGALVASLRAQGFDAQPVDDLATAVGDADIISCATLSSASLIEGAWLRPGVHLDLVGAFTPAMREADAEAVARCRVYADTEAALAECGELQQMRASDLAGTLASLCAGAGGRQSEEAMTLFKSVGTAIEDLAAAIIVAGSRSDSLVSQGPTG